VIATKTFQEHFPHSFAVIRIPKKFDGCLAFWRENLLDSGQLKSVCAVDLILTRYDTARNSDFSLFVYCIVVLKMSTDAKNVNLHVEAI